MHATRTTATFLVGAALAALTGCVSVDTPPPAPPPSPRVSGPAQGVDVAPQIVEGPAREALEAALPAPPPPSRRATPSPYQERRGSTVRNGTGGERPSPVPQQRSRAPKPRPPAPPRLPAVPEPPRSRAEVCELGGRYGGWHPDSPQATICRNTYAR